jgi:tetratricopeptide (TPR) repeat protein
MPKNNRQTTRGNLRLGAVLALSLLLLPATIAPSFSEESAPQNSPNQAGAQTSPAASASSQPASDLSSAVKADDGAATTSGDGTGKVIYKPGIPITVNTAAEDLQPTDDVDVATKQFYAYPDNPEAAFLLAVALTRTSRVEDALQQVRKAKNLANKQGGPAYFDKMISSYEHMLEYCPDDNRIRYTLAWAYYMKAYMLSKTAQAAAKAQGADTQHDSSKQPGKDKKIDVGTAGNVLAMINPTLAQGIPATGKVSTSQLPHLPSAIEMAPTAAQGEVRKYYDLAVKNLDDLLSHNPDDFLAREYRAHLLVEETGDLKAAMKVWQDAAKEHPQNPAAYFFLAEAYLKLGNLKDSIGNIARAIQLRSVGM